MVYGPQTGTGGITAGPFLQQLFTSPEDLLVLPQADDPTSSLLGAALMPPPEPRHHMEPVRSELDRWALKNCQCWADELTPEQTEELGDHIKKLAEKDKEYWQARNNRQIRDQQRFDLKLPQDNKLTKSTEPEEEAEDSEVVVLPDPFLYIHKIDNMLAMAGYRYDVPCTGPETMQKSQLVEAFLDWFMEQVNVQWVHALHSQFLRDVVHNGNLRGWITGLLLTDVSNPSFPYYCCLEDPLDVYPRYTRRKLVRVTHQFVTSVLEARSDYPEVEDILSDRDEGDELEVIGYYDEVYHCILVAGLGNGPNGEYHQMVKPPVPHGQKDLQGTPYVPWIIVTPIANNGSRGGDGKASTENVGMGLLFGVEEVYLQFCKVLSELLSNVARSADPATIRYVDPGNPNTTPIKIGAGARNYAAYNREKVEILDLAPNPGNLQPVLQILGDRLNKATLPSVFWGDAGSVTSGYGVGLLTNAARDILSPYITAVESFLSMLFRRALESYVNIIAPAVGPLPIMQRNSMTGSRQSGVLFDPSVVMETGVDVTVKFGEITPQDEAALTGSMIQLVGSGISSVYSARKKLGMKDPLTETRWRALEAMLADPSTAIQYATMVESMSDDEILQVIQAQRAAAMQMAQQAAVDQGTTQGESQGPMATQDVPLERQVGPGGRAGQQPARENPQDIATRQRNETVAALSGGSPARRTFMGR